MNIDGIEFSVRQEVISRVGDHRTIAMIALLEGDSVENEFLIGILAVKE